MASIGDFPYGHAQQRAFVVGAPRCGTTALSHYLGAHPDVCFSSVKEPHYFSQHDLTELRGEELRRLVDSDYLARFFGHCRDPGRLFAEGSVTYLYAAERMEPILRLWPDAKFVIALRNPLEMVPSLHQRLLYNGDETEADFARAWRLVEERRQGRRVPRTCADARWLDYREVGLLGKHVERFLAAVGEERCFIAVYDDFAADPSAQYRRLLEFLGLADDGRTDFSEKRARQGFKIGWLQRLLKRPPRLAMRVLASDQYRQRFEKVPRRGPGEGNRNGSGAIRAMRKRLLRWNRAPAPPVRIPDAVLREMEEAFREDNALLSRVINRDLSHWIDGGAATLVRAA